MEMISGGWNVGMISTQVVSRNGYLRRMLVLFARRRLLNEVVVEDDNCFILLDQILKQAKVDLVIFLREIIYSLVIAPSHSPIALESMEYLYFSNMPFFLFF
jgi:hypothetical protein